MSKDNPVCGDCSTGGKDFPCRISDRFDPMHIAETYLRNFRSKYGNEPDVEAYEATWWAWGCLSKIVFDGNPDLALDVVLIAMTMLKDDHEVSFLAAGPLEDLVRKRGDEIIDRIECEAAGSADFRYLLSGIWGGNAKDSDIWRRVQIAVKPGPWLDDDPRTPQGSAGWSTNGDA